MKYRGRRGQGTNDGVWNALCSFLSLRTMHRAFAASRSRRVHHLLPSRSLHLPQTLSLISPRQPQQPAGWTTRSPSEREGEIRRQRRRGRKGEGKSTRTCVRSFRAARNRLSTASRGNIVVVDPLIIVLRNHVKYLLFGQLSHRAQHLEREFRFPSFLLFRQNMPSVERETRGDDCTAP